MPRRNGNAAEDHLLSTTSDAPTHTTAPCEPHSHIYIYLHIYAMRRITRTVLPHVRARANNLRASSSQFCTILCALCIYVYIYVYVCVYVIDLVWRQLRDATKQRVHISARGWQVRGGCGSRHARRRGWINDLHVLYRSAPNWWAQASHISLLDRWMHIHFAGDLFQFTRIYYIYMVSWRAVWNRLNYCVEVKWQWIEECFRVVDITLYTY